jgi:N-ethylmaleimide reductase
MLLMVLSITKVGVRLNPSLHNAQGMMLDEQTIPTHEYIINRLNDYGLAYIHLTEFYRCIWSACGSTEVAKHFRPFYKGTLIIKSFNKETGIKVVKMAMLILLRMAFPLLQILIWHVMKRMLLWTHQTKVHFTPIR